MTIFSSDPLTCRNQIYASSILLMLLQAVLLYLAPPTRDPRRFYLLILSQIFNIAMIQFSCAIVCTYKDVVLLHTKLLQLLFCHYYFGMGATVVSCAFMFIFPWLHYSTFPFSSHPVSPATCLAGRIFPDTFIVCVRQDFCPVRALSQWSQLQWL